jgi:hypothetical protein
MGRKQTILRPYEKSLTHCRPSSVLFNSNPCVCAQEEYLRWVRRLAAHTGLACASLATQDVLDSSGTLPPATAATADAGEKSSRSIPPCPCCGKTMEFVRRIKPLDFWIRTSLTPPPAATGWTPVQARPPNPGSPPRPAMQPNQQRNQLLEMRWTNLKWTGRSGACALIPAPVKKGPFCLQFSIPTSRRAMPKAPALFETQTPASLCPVPMPPVRTGLKKQSA